MKSRTTCLAAAAAASLSFLLCALPAHAAPTEPLPALAAREQAPLLDTLKDLVSIESGSADREGLDRIADLIAARLRALGGEVQQLEAGSDAYRMADTPQQIGKMVLARFHGNGDRRLLLIAHMDTVYQRGMLARQPFRIDGDRAYGLAIADDKQGIAVILHTLAILKKLGYQDYREITVMINGDEEISSPGSRAMLTRLGAEADAVLSFESSLVESDRLALTTAGIGAFVLNVEGRASHAGAAPDKGRNALYELAHQVLQTRDLSDPAIGLKMNWTIANAGSVRNVIPANATASADVRVLRIADYDSIEQKVRERINNKLIADTKVSVAFERRRPPLEMTPASEALARRAQQIYAEIGRKLEVGTVAEGGGTDAAFAALKARGAVLERCGLQGFGAHTNNAEYIDINSIQPRLYLVARLLMDAARR